MNEHYLSFLRWCLQPSDSRDTSAIDGDLGAMDWQGLFEFAKRQSISGIISRALIEDGNRLTELRSFSGNQPERRLLIQFMAAETIAERRNRMMNEHCVKITDLFRRAGYRSCILKGQGNTLLYPYPWNRMAGDIDLWVDGPRWDVFRLVRRQFPDAPFKCQHIEYPLWEKAPVEVHFYPMYLECPWHNRVLKRFFREQREQQFAHLVTLPGTTEPVAVPTPFFNAIYQLTHINVHVLIEGIGLRQFIDYYYVLRHLPHERHEEVRQWLGRMGLTNLARATMYIVHDVLGLPDAYLYLPPDDRRGRRLMRDIEIGGNFGKYDERMGHIGEGFWHRQVRKLIKNGSFVRDYPAEELSEPFFRIWHWTWRQWYQAKWKLSGK